MRDGNCVLTGDEEGEERTFSDETSGLAVMFLHRISDWMESHIMCHLATPNGKKSFIESSGFPVTDVVIYKKVSGSSDVGFLRSIELLVLNKQGLTPLCCSLEAYLVLARTTKLLKGFQFRILSSKFIIHKYMDPTPLLSTNVIFSWQLAAFSYMKSNINKIFNLF